MELVRIIVSPESLWVRENSIFLCSSGITWLILIACYSTDLKVICHGIVSWQRSQEKWKWPVSLRWDVLMLFSCMLICIIQIFYNCFTFCDSVLVSLLSLSETNSMTHWCCMTCPVVLFMLITIALLLVTCLTSTTMLGVLPKLRTGLIATGVCSPFEQDKNMSVPPAACPPPVQRLLLHLGCWTITLPQR